MVRAKRLSGSSLTEVLIASVIGTTVLVSSVSAYALMAKRTAHDTAQSIVTNQVYELAEEFERSISKSYISLVVEMGEIDAIYCLIPQGATTNKENINDIHYPHQVTPEGKINYSPGQLIFYMPTVQSATGSELALWRIKYTLIATPSTPIGMRYDDNWSSVNGKPRWNAIKSVNFVPDYSSNTITYTIVGEIHKSDNIDASQEIDPSQIARCTLTKTVKLRYAY